MTESCEVCDKTALIRCSECQSAHYCSAECQKADWPSHQAGCEIRRGLNKHNAQTKAAPKKTASTRCTGCNTRWSEEFVCAQECSDCGILGYSACEDCAIDIATTDRGNIGACYCPTSNFGAPYCEREPAWYHSTWKEDTLHRK
ncbi:hypothetical protein BOTBODRAFT_163913 [Botryobasidium botryosum FD-172 SS1]|uniref:MYND-type domain-containing protein n=1 Tax=Botryobasidium botryosum (strain FD-172 SS1) TaxID=930990 RepID=A0A067M4A3_BOTB1|nr:hypothetical protein BOTBODRAFT_163913 [Botryobasidium botryosum FD-172 SS1]